MIKAIVILNSNGKTRLVRLYDDSVRLPSTSQCIQSKEALVKELFAAIQLRKEAYCNFIDDLQSVVAPAKVVYR